MDIQNIPERTGQMLREALQQQFYTAGPPATQLYSLSVSYGISATGVGIENDTAATRNRYVANATWTLAPSAARPPRLPKARPAPRTPPM